MIRDMKKFNVEAFSEDVNNKLEYLSCSLNDDPNAEIHNILSAITEATNLHAPLKKLSGKKMKIKAKPWLTKDLLESISIKNKLFEQCYKQHRPHLVSKYNTYLKKVTKLKETAKRNYYQNELQKHKNNISMQWKIINKILCHKRLESNSIRLITDEQKGKITDKNMIPDLLKEYFTKIGPKMDAKIPAATKHFTFSSLPNYFMYDPISESEVYSQILQLNPVKAAGPENVPIKFLKRLSPVISTYLRDAFNKCYETRIFPNSLKNAKIVPIHKAKQKDIASNHRPISLLSPISKIFEKLLYSRLE